MISDAITPNRRHSYVFVNTMLSKYGMIWQQKVASTCDFVYPEQVPLICITVCKIAWQVNM